MHINDFKLIVETQNDILELGKKIAFKSAQLQIMKFINSHKRLDKNTSYYRMSIDEIVEYIEKMEYKS